MKKLNNEDIMDYLDGALDASRLAAFEEHLRSNAEDAQLVAEMKMAMSALHEEAAEPVRVSADFWPKLREKLPEKPRRSWINSLAAQAGAWVWPSHSKLGLSVRVAAVAVFIAMAAFLFAPKQAVQHSEAGNKPTTDDIAFIRKSVGRDAEYRKAAPGDTRNAEHGDEDGESGNGPQ